MEIKHKETPNSDLFWVEDENKAIKVKNSEDILGSRFAVKKGKYKIEDLEIVDIPIEEIPIEEIQEEE